MIQVLSKTFTSELLYFSQELTISHESVTNGLGDHVSCHQKDMAEVELLSQ